MGLVLSSGSDKAPFQISAYQHKKKGLSDEYTFYILSSAELVLVVSIYHRDAYIINKTITEHILRWYYISGTALEPLFNLNTISSFIPYICCLVIIISSTSKGK